MNVYFHTFGCKANQYDTELVRQAFADQGAVVVDDTAAADVAVVNSCTVTAESETKLRRLVRGLARRDSKLATVVIGCAAALDDGRIAGLPSVRAVVGGADPGAVLEAAGVAHARLEPVLRRFHANARGWLKIQDGCDEHCTFCATTIARGANRSRPIPELIAEARALSEHHAEIVLTGVHIGTYGQDRERGNGKGERSSPGELLEALIAAVPQVRFRLSSIEATEVDDRIAQLLTAAPRSLAAHLHAPLQSGSNRVLKRMGRPRVARGAAAGVRARRGRDRGVSGGDRGRSPRHSRTGRRVAVHLSARVPVQRAARRSRGAALGPTLACYGARPGARAAPAGRGESARLPREPGRADGRRRGERPWGGADRIADAGLPFGLSSYDRVGRASPVRGDGALVPFQLVWANEADQL
ncbi:MAG: radical SAM protein, partial [Actinobacteria bacterium]